MPAPVAGADLTFDQDFRDRVRAAAFGLDLERVQGLPVPKPKQTDARPRAEIQAELRAASSGTRGRQL
jgi:hypothetical protein